MFRQLLATVLGAASQLHGDDADVQQASQLSSSYMDMPGSWPASPTNPPLSGFLAGSINTNASNSIFTEVGGKNNVVYITQNPDPSFAVLNKLPHAEGVGYRYTNHRTCLDGTRIAELKQIQDWEADHTTKPVYWLRGVPGSGKSTIARTFAERSAAAGRLGVGFFCSRDFTDKRNIRLIFPTLAYHFALQSPEFRAGLIPVINENPLIHEETLDVQFDQLLVRPLQLMQIRTTFIIDALDECEDDQPASAILFVLGRYINSIPLVKWFITGRPELPIRKGFSLASLQPRTEVFLLHDVDRVSVDQDIELYLRTGLSEVATERSHFDLTVPWPEDIEITVTIEKCAGLFIVASVIVKFVSSRHHEPRERLKIIISTPNSTTHEGRSGIDGTYHQVLHHSFEDVNIDETEFFVRLRSVIGSIVVAFNPLSCANLSAILGVTTARVWTALRSLHSIFIIPDSESEPIRVCHKSLADYLIDRTRCTDARFYIDPSVHHLEIALFCLRMMNSSLKKNICELPRYVMNAEVDDLEGRRRTYIGGGLEYGCKFWTKHLRLGSKDGEDVGQVVECLTEFLSRHLLGWLEVLSMIGDLQCAVYSLQDVIAWLIDIPSPDTDLSVIVKDSEIFVLRFFDAIQSSASHIYESALPFSPSSSVVRALYEGEMSTNVKIGVIDNSWDACIRTIRSRNDVNFVEFSHKDDLIAICGDEAAVEIFEAATGQRRATLIATGESIVGSLAFSSDDTLLVTGHDDRANVWDIQTGSPVGALVGHTDVICSIGFSPCGTMIATSSEDHTIRIWNSLSFDCRCVLKGHSDAVLTVCWSAMGGQVVSGSADTTVKVWDVSSMKCSNTLTMHTEPVDFVSSSPDSPLTISASSKTGMIKVFDVDTGKVLHTVTTDRRLIEQVRFLNQEQVMYASRGTFVIRDLLKSVDVSRFEYEGWAEVISSDGTRIVSSQSGELVMIWRTNGVGRNEDVADHHTDQVLCVSFSTDGQLIASGSFDKTVKILDVSTRQCLTTFRDHTDGVVLISFSPDSTLCGSWGRYDIVRVWDVRTGSPVSTLDAGTVHGMCFSPDGSQLASVRDQCYIDLWEVTTGNRLASIEVESFLGTEVRDISFDDDEPTSIIVRTANNTYRCRLSPSRESKSSANANPSSNESSNDSDVHSGESSINDDTNKHSLSIVLFPVEYIEPSLPYQYRIEPGSSWVVDKQERRVLWVPPDLKQVSDSHGTNVALGSIGGRVTILYFSDVDQPIRSQ